MYFLLFFTSHWKRSVKAYGVSTTQTKCCLMGTEWAALCKQKQTKHKVLIRFIREPANDCAFEIPSKYTEENGVCWSGTGVSGVYLSMSITSSHWLHPGGTNQKYIYIYISFIFFAISLSCFKTASQQGAPASADLCLEAYGEEEEEGVHCGSCMKG